MNKNFISLGLMSGTSGDGIDTSLVNSDGDKKCEIIGDKYIPYPANISNDYQNLRDKIDDIFDLEKFKKEIEDLELKITNFHKLVCQEWIKNYDIDLIGFHGQTIYHNSKEKTSIQLGDGYSLSKNLNKTIVYNFRTNDILNGGEGAPLSPIYHKQVVEKIKSNYNIETPVTILNIGGISNITTINNSGEMISRDIGPGNCLIDRWVRLNSENNYDFNGDIAKSGKVDKFILDQSLENYFYSKISKKRSLDTNDFDINFVRGLSLKDGAATLTKFTTEILSRHLPDKNIIICGGGRNNIYLINQLKKNKKNVEKIDNYNFNGDFIESQAFAYLAIRSLIKLPITFPSTTGCNRPVSGGKIINLD